MSKWHKVEKSKPTPFDLVIIVDADGATQPAWWTGQCWDGREIRIKEPVAWRRRSDGTNN
jgi:hypothetical protein